MTEYILLNLQQKIHAIFLKGKSSWISQNCTQFIKETNQEGEGDTNNREYISDGGHWAGQDIMELFYTPSSEAINQGQEAGGRRQGEGGRRQVLGGEFLQEG